MGFRYRKSINLGGGFRINLSKSGVGYSWGVKGYRVTKTARGTTRTTASIPGTGFSYVHETGRSKKKHRQKDASATRDNCFDTQNIENSVGSDTVSEGLESMLASASEALRLERIALIGLICCNVWLFPLNIYFAVKLHRVRTQGVINLEYAIDDDQQFAVNSRLDPIMKITESSKVWRIMRTSKVIDRKYAAGASNLLKRRLCSATTKAPFPFVTNAQVVSFNLKSSFKFGIKDAIVTYLFFPTLIFRWLYGYLAKREILLFLPDKLFIIQGSRIGALNYSDVDLNIDTTRFIEDEKVPKDAQVVDRTWKYVNRDGSRDRRFSSNKSYPVCLYGKLEVRSTSGLNTVIMYSRPEIKTWEWAD